MKYMLFNELHNKKQQIISAAHKYGASEVQVFGSVARGTETESSDVDFLVSLPRGYDMFKQRIPLKEELEVLIGREVGLIVKHEINRHIIGLILQEARDL